MNGWIRVKDRLPEKEGDYLCFLESGDLSVGYFSRWFHDMSGFEPQAVGMGDVTHWMPLPEPPEVSA